METATGKDKDIYEFSDLGFKNPETAFRMMNDTRFQTAQLIVGQSKEKIAANPQVLIASRLYFEQLFNINTNLEQSVEFLDLDPTAVKSLICCMHTGQLVISAKNAEKQYLAATAFKMGQVREKCLSVLANNITIANCLNVQKYTSTFNGNSSASASAGIQRFVQDNFKDVTESDDFLRLGRSDLDNLLNRFKDAVSQEVLIRAFIRWSAVDPNELSYFFNKFVRIRELSVTSFEIIKGAFVVKSSPFRENSPSYELYMKICQIYAQRYFQNLRDNELRQEYESRNDQVACLEKLSEAEREKIIQEIRHNKDNLKT